MVLTVTDHYLRLDEEPFKRCQVGFQALAVFLSGGSASSLDGSGGLFHHMAWVG